MSGWATQRRRTEGRSPRLSGTSAHSRRPHAGGPCIVMRDARHPSEMATMINRGGVAGVVAWWWWLFGAFGSLGLKCTIQGKPKETFITTPPANAAEATSFVARKVSARCTQASLWACEYHSSGLIPARPQAHAQTTGNKRARRANLASGVQLAAKFLATSFVASRATGHEASNAPALSALASFGSTSQRLLSTQHSATSEMIPDLIGLTPNSTLANGLPRRSPVLFGTEHIPCLNTSVRPPKGYSL